MNGSALAEPLRLTWAANAEIVQGNAFGYTAASRNLMKAMGRRSDVELSDDAPVAVHFCHPKNFEPENHPGAFNVLFTMYEMHPPPEFFAEGMRKADMVVVPSRYCHDLLYPMLPSKERPPFATCRLGYDPSVFQYFGRRKPPAAGEPFRWLWLGAANERKGWKLLSMMWAVPPDEMKPKIYDTAGNVMPSKDPPDPAFVTREDMVLYLKTTRWQDHDSEQERLFRVQNVIYDERRLSRPDMASLYDGAHAFIFPSYGEGFGLTALEAMVTGLPVVTIDYSGMREFLSTRYGAVFAGYDEVELLVGSNIEENRTACAMRPRMLELRQGMKDVMENYPAYLKRARKGAEMAAKEFTWDRAADELVRILRARRERRTA